MGIDKSLNPTSRGSTVAEEFVKRKRFSLVRSRSGQTPESRRTEGSKSGSSSAEYSRDEWKKGMGYQDYEGKRVKMKAFDWLVSDWAVSWSYETSLLWKWSRSRLISASKRLCVNCCCERRTQTTEKIGQSNATSIWKYKQWVTVTHEMSIDWETHRSEERSESPLTSITATSWFGEADL